LKAIEDDWEDVTSVEKMFLKGNEFSGGVSKDFYTFNGQNHFVGIKVNILVE